MNDVQQRIYDLRAKGWTLEAIAVEVGVSPRAVEYWRVGKRYPGHATMVLMALDQLLKRRRVPKRLKYVPGSRQQSG